MRRLKVDTEGAEVAILTGFRHLSTVKVLLSKRTWSAETSRDRLTSPRFR